MKIAFAFSGLLRGMDDLERVHSLSRRIKELGGDVYASFWDDTPNFEKALKIFKTNFAPLAVEVENHKSWKSSTAKILSKELCNPAGVDGLEPRLAKIHLEGQAFSQWYKIWKANMLTKEYEIDYDVVVRIRTDHPFDTNLTIEKNEYINVIHGAIFIDGWPGCIGPRDQYVYGSPDNMDYYSSIFLYASRYLKEGVYIFPPENVLRHHLAVKNVLVKAWPDAMNDLIQPEEPYVVKISEMTDVEFDPLKRFYSP